MGTGIYLLLSIFRPSAATTHGEQRCYEGGPNLRIATVLLLLSVVVFSTGRPPRMKKYVMVRQTSRSDVEDYSSAVTLHRKFLSSHPNDALAHYHLGFAYGMVGRPG